MIDPLTSLVLIFTAFVIGLLVGPSLEELATRAAVPASASSPVDKARSNKPAPDNPYRPGTASWFQFNRGYHRGALATYSLSEHRLIARFHFHAMANASEVSDDPYHGGWLHAARPEYQRVIAKHTAETRAPLRAV